jgi:hypothetical protein
MRLTILLPEVGPVMVGRWKNRVAYVEREVPLETTVYKIKRIARNGKFDAGQIVAHAYIPPQYRGGVEARDWRWQDAETLRVFVNIKDNMKTLRPFLDSHDAEWDVREKA